MKAVIAGDSITYNGITIKLDDIYTDEFYKYSDARADEFKNDTYAVNDMYNNVVQDYLALQYFIEENNITKIDIRQAKPEIAYYAKDLSQMKNIGVVGSTLIKSLSTSIKYFFNTLAETVYFIWLMFKIKSCGEFENSDKIAVVRTKAGIKKLKQFPEVHSEVEDVFNKNSIYRLFPLSSRVKWLIKAYFKSWRTLSALTSFYCEKMGQWTKYSIESFYQKRIVYAEFYKLMLDEFFSHYEGKEFYTANNLDRYSVIEDMLAYKHHIKSYNIPHGIEYGFKFPKGFSSDVFYTHSQYTADYLNKLYSTDKYVFDSSVISRMFSYHCDTPHDQMVIFFTEPREVYVNIEIINSLQPELQLLGKKLYLKLHPGDSKENYNGLDIEYITDYNLSLTGNICISRKSTILLEAIYNNSIPVAIITNPKDNSTFNMFPSLNAKEIIKTLGVSELVEVIKSNLR